MRGTYKPVILAVSLLFALSASVSAAPGDLDLSFGNGGIVRTITDFYHLSSREMLVQPDGKIVVCGWILDEDDNGVSFFLARYHPTGALDASFGANGRIIGPYLSGGLVGNGIALQPDGKIIAVGPVFLGGSAVHRYHANGTLDASFGTGGVVITPAEFNSDAKSVAVQADGKIVVVGYSNPQQQNYDFTVVRYNPDGSLDTSFNCTGKVITSFGNGSAALKVILQPDGKIVALGGASTGITSAFALVRYNADGSLDSGFGVGGKVIHAVSSGSSGIFDAVLQPDGKIVATGYLYSRDFGSASAIVRYNPNGSIDTTFATNGIFTTEFGFSVSNGIARQSDA